jgi:hypothetical protein
MAKKHELIMDMDRKGSRPEHHVANRLGPGAAIIGRDE